MKVDETLKAFLAEVDTAFLATADDEGQPYVQHRGGPKGFIRALDDRTIGFLDFAGNRQYLTVGNLEVNPRVCLFLIDYATRRRVKIWGTARVAPVEGKVAERLKLDGYKARVERAIVIDVTRWDINCPAHIPRKLNA